jgi:hypothetical protein
VRLIRATIFANPPRVPSLQPTTPWGIPLGQSSGLKINFGEVWMGLWIVFGVVDNRILL